jgi:hypothetical protein
VDADAFPAIEPVVPSDTPCRIGWIVNVPPLAVVRICVI